MLKKDAERITGGLSAPGKMPEGSYNIPASACQTGAKLRLVPDTPCYKCYAFKGRYNFPNVKNALARRLKSLDHPQWVEGMTTLVKKIKHFRWHDSGDIQSVAHLKNIYERDSNKAFENAKLKGLNKPEDFMYMYSKENKDFFKNIMDRKYVSFEQ